MLIYFFLDSFFNAFHNIINNKKNIIANISVNSGTIILSSSSIHTSDNLYYVNLYILKSLFYSIYIMLYLLNKLI